MAAEAISQHCMLPACHAPLEQKYLITQVIPNGVRSETPACADVMLAHARRCR